MPDSQLLREIRQTKPFRSQSQEAALSVMRTAHLIQRNYSRIVEPHGLTIQQYNVLRILRGAGESGLPTLEIGERMIEQTPGITRLLDRLETKGLVARERCPEDRRRVTCRITRTGLALLAKLDDHMNRSDGIFDADISPADLKRLVELLDRMRKVLESM